MLAWVTTVALLAQPPSLGRITFPTSGSPRAQPAFVRGVLLLHSFEYDDAIAAFQQAERTDPSFALAYWGEALCYNQALWYNENLAKARAALNRLAPTRAARLAKAPTPREQGYVDAVDVLFGDGDKASRDRAYAERMSALSRQYPDDDEAAVFSALALLAAVPSGERNIALMQKAGAIALAVLKRNPEHPGAAHYALHAFDDGEHAAMGLEAARTYARFAPASSHARHMPSHVFLPLGMWDEAVASDESAFAASVAFARRKGLSVAQQDFHSLSWLQYEYLQQGRFSKAREAMGTVESAIVAEGSTGSTGSRASTGSMHSMDSDMHVESEIGRGYGPMSLKNERASMRARLVLESGDWAVMKGQGTFDNVDELLALGIASIGQGDTARALAAFENLQTAVKTIPDPDAREVAQIMVIELDGMQRLARGDRPGALATLARAAALEAKRPRSIARPYPVKPAGELYAEILLGTGDAAAAITQFQSTLARTPRRAVALLGLSRAFEAAGRHADAAKAAQEFLQVWHLADPNRPELQEARMLLR